jgi:hypothetical protein
MSSPDPEPISDLQEYLSAQHPPLPQLLLALPRILYPNHLLEDTLCAQLRLTVICDYAGGLVDLMFPFEAVRSGLGLLSLKDVVGDYLRSLVSCSPVVSLHSLLS